MSPWFFDVYMDEVIKEVGIGMGRRGVRFQKILCGDSEGNGGTFC